MWGLDGMLRQAFGTLSGGQRQRLFLALALVNRPRLVFLDELTQGLDPAARRDTWALVEQARDRGATVVLVTHDMDEAERLCDRVAVMSDGVVVAWGAPSELVGFGGPVAMRFSSSSASALEGLERVPGVVEVRFDGRVARVSGEPRSVVLVAAELARRDVVRRRLHGDPADARGLGRGDAGWRSVMSRLALVEARLLARDWTVLVFAFVFPVFCMVVLAGVFGDQPDDGFGNVRPDDYYVVASLGVPVIALCLVGLPVSLASYRERGVLRRFEAFGVPAWRVVAAQALVTLGLVVVGAVLVLALASFTYGIPSVVYGWQTVVGAVVGVVCLLLLGVVVGLAGAVGAGGAGRGAAGVLPALSARRRWAAAGCHDGPDGRHRVGAAVADPRDHRPLARRAPVQRAARGARRVGSRGAWSPRCGWRGEVDVPRAAASCRRALWAWRQKPEP